MKPKGGRRVEIQIEMVDEMKTPQPRHAMRKCVPRVQRVVHQHDRDRHVKCTGQTSRMQQSTAASLCHRCERQDNRPFEEIDSRRCQTGEHEVP